MTDAPLRLAMWSGPRNISTALMRSWEARGDAAVCDEPLYAHYLYATGKKHPGADEVIQRGETDWRRVVRHLLEDRPARKVIYFQKHMAHHLLPDMDRDWLDGLTNAFLIRSPEEMLVSLTARLGDVRLEDTGLPQQLEIFNHVRRRTGRTPPVIDSRDVLEDPGHVLRLLCEALGVPYMEAMLSWPPGPRVTDGVWGEHWYATVVETTGFQPYRPRAEGLPARLAHLHEECQSLYDVLYSHRLR